jgi:hypothetical protein
MDMTNEDYQDYINSVCDQMSVQEYLFWFQHFPFGGLTTDPTMITYDNPQEENN